ALTANADKVIESIGLIQREGAEVARGTKVHADLTEQMGAVIGIHAPKGGRWLHMTGRSTDRDDGSNQSAERDEAGEVFQPIDGSATEQLDTDERPEH